MATETASGAGEPGDRPRVSGYDQLRTAREAVEEALLSPTGDTVTWQATMTTGLRTLEGAFRRHREVSEAPGGTLDEAVKRLPELARAARGQRLEHGDILEEIDALLAKLAGKEDTGPADPEAIRWHVGRLQESIRRHLAKGGDFLYEAFVREEGGEG